MDVFKRRQLAVEILGGLLQVQAHAGQVFIAGQVEVPQRLGNLLVINGFLHCNHLRHAKSSRERFSISDYSKFFDRFLKNLTLAVFAVDLFLTTSFSKTDSEDYKTR